MVGGCGRPLFGRGYTTAEGGFRVPTIMWWPGRIPAGTVCDQLATTMDLLPTFARKGQEPEPLLFHVVDDVGSTRNVAHEYPDQVRRLTALAEAARADLGDAGRPGAHQRPSGKVDHPQPRLLER